MIYAFGDYRIDSALFQITRADTVLPVEPQVLDLLIALIDKRDQVVTRNELFDTIWKGRIVSDTTLSSRIKTARHVIGDDGRRQRWIKTVHGRGFRFIGDVSVTADGPRDERSQQPEPPTVPRPETRYAKSGNVHVAYHLFGNGPVNLIMVPGYISHIEHFWDEPGMNRFLTRLGEHARFAIFDKRGTGLSDKVDALPGMDERMDDVRAVMDAADFDSAFVMGISEGGSLAALFAAYHPQRCDGLIQYGAFAQFKHWIPDEASLQAFFDYVESDWGSGKNLPQVAPSVGNDPAFVEWWGKGERLGATPGACIALIQMNSKIDISDVLPSIRVPTLVIHRTDDVLVDVEGGRQLAAEIPGAQLLELPGVDHLPMVGDNRDEIVNAILDFIQRPPTLARPNRVLATIVLLRIGAKTATAPADSALTAVKDQFGHYRAGRILSDPPIMTATFNAPARALECAYALSVELRRAGVGHQVGVHTGEVDLNEREPRGVAMSVAADIADHARPNEVLASRTVHDLVTGSGVELEDGGIFTLPSIKQDWRLYRLREP